MLSITYPVSHISLAVVVLLSMSHGLAGTSISAERTNGKKEEKQEKRPDVNAEITIKIVPSANKTFGYDILLFLIPDTANTEMQYPYERFREFHHPTAR